MRPSREREQSKLPIRPSATAAAERAGACRRDWLWDTELPGFGVRLAKQAHLRPALSRRRRWARARQRKYKIGRFGPLNSTQARRRRSSLRHVARGEDPAGERQEKRNDPTVADLLDDFLAHHADAKRKPRTAERIPPPRRPHHQARPWQARVKELETADVPACIRSWNNAAPGQSRACDAVEIRELGRAHGYRAKFSNPAKGSKNTRRRAGALPVPAGDRAARQGACGFDEWPTAIAAIRLLIFTGARHTEITTLRWEQVDMQRGIARLDAKTGSATSSSGAGVAGARRSAAPGRQRLCHLGQKHRRAPDRPASIWERIREVPISPTCGFMTCGTRRAHRGAGGASLRLVGAVLGHVSVLTTGRYAHVADDPAKAVAEKVAARSTR